MIATANIWADVIATFMVVVAVSFWLYQLAGNAVTGRFRRKFVGKEWPHHEKTIPLLPRALHGTHVAAMIVLAFSGLYLRFPFFSGGREVLRNAHYVAMYIFLAIFVLRVYYAYVRDSAEFRISIRDILNAPRVLLYYMFFRRSYPHLGKYNVMQKFTYGIAFPLLIVVQAYTGFALIWPGVLLPWAGPLAGGLSAAAGWARLVHFLGSMSLIMLVSIHVCLAFVEDFPTLLVFFGLTKQIDEEDREEEKQVERRLRGTEAAAH